MRWAGIATLSDKLQFPFTSQVYPGPKYFTLWKKETRWKCWGWLPSSECEHEMFVEMRWKKRNLAVPLSQLQIIGGGEETKEAVADWHYWVGQGYQF